MKQTYNKPETFIVRIATSVPMLSGSTQSSGLDGVTSAEYTGGAVNWSRRNSVWDEDED